MRKLGLVLALAVISLALLAGCVAPSAPPPNGGENPWILPIFIVVIFVVFYFLMVRPQQKRQKQQQQMIAELQKGNQIITAGGIYGVIDSLDPESIVIKVESGAMMRVARGSVIGRRGQ